MTIDQILHAIGNPRSRTVTGLLISIIFVLLTGIQIAPIKINPWDAILNWIGSKMNSKVEGEIQDTRNQVSKIETDLQFHIKESKERDVKITRRAIFDFMSEELNGIKHTKEDWDNIIHNANWYQNYCRVNDIPNGVADATIQELNQRYARHLSKNDFMTLHDIGFILHGADDEYEDRHAHPVDEHVPIEDERRN